MTDYAPTVTKKYIDNIYVVETIGDSNCFYHSLLTCLDDDYFNSTSYQYKKERSVQIRQYISDNLFSTDNKPSNWEKAKRCEYFDLFVQTEGNFYVPDEIFNEVNKCFSDQSFEVIPIVCEILKINIVLYSEVHGDMIYRCNDNTQITIILLGRGKGFEKDSNTSTHYESLGIMFDGQIKTKFQAADFEDLPIFDSDQHMRNLIENDEHYNFLKQYSTDNTLIKKCLNRIVSLRK